MCIRDSFPPACGIVIEEPPQLWAHICKINACLWVNDWSFAVDNSFLSKASHWKQIIWLAHPVNRATGYILLLWCTSDICWLGKAEKHRSMGWQWRYWATMTHVVFVYAPILFLMPWWLQLNGLRILWTLRLILPVLFIPVKCHNW